MLLKFFLIQFIFSIITTKKQILKTGKGLSVLKVLRITCEVCRTEFKYTLGPRRAGDPAVVLAKASLAEKLLEWTPKHSDAETLLETSLRAYRKIT